MLEKLQVISFSFKPNEKWVVVMVNDCRAIVVPLAGRDPMDPEVMFSELDLGHQSVSPNSEVTSHGWARGHVRDRRVIAYDPEKLRVPLTSYRSAKADEEKARARVDVADCLAPLDTLGSTTLVATPVGFDTLIDCLVK